MRSAISVFLALCFSAPALAQPDEQALAVVQKALKAHGGAAGLKRLRVARVTYVLQGQVPFLPAAGLVDATVEETYQLPTQIKKVFRGKAGGEDFTLAW